MLACPRVRTLLVLHPGKAARKSSDCALIPSMHTQSVIISMWIQQCCYHHCGCCQHCGLWCNNCCRWRSKPSAPQQYRRARATAAPGPQQSSAAAARAASAAAAASPHPQFYDHHQASTTTTAAAAAAQAAAAQQAAAPTPTTAPHSHQHCQQHGGGCASATCYHCYTRPGSSTGTRGVKNCGQQDCRHGDACTGAHIHSNASPGTPGRHQSEHSRASTPPV